MFNGLHFKLAHAHHCLSPLDGFHFIAVQTLLATGSVVPRDPLFTLPAINSQRVKFTHKYLLAANCQMCPGFVVADLSRVEQLELLGICLEQVERAALVEG